MRLLAQLYPILLGLLGLLYFFVSAMGQGVPDPGSFAIASAILLSAVLISFHLERRENSR